MYSRRPSTAPAEFANDSGCLQANANSIALMNLSKLAASSCLFSGNISVQEVARKRLKGFQRHGSPKDTI